MIDATLNDTMHFPNIIARIHIIDDGDISLYFRLEYIGGGYMAQSDDWTDGEYWEEAYGYTVVNKESGKYEIVTDKYDYYLLDRLTDFLQDQDLYLP